MWLRRFLILLLVAAPVTLAHVIGQDHLHWDHPGVDTNGQPTEVTQYTLYCGKSNSSESIVYAILDPLLQSATLSELGLSDGSWTCELTASNSVGESARSEPLSFFVIGGSRVNPAVPAAPFNLRIEDS